MRTGQEAGAFGAGAVLGDFDEAATMALAVVIRVDGKKVDIGGVGCGPGKGECADVAIEKRGRIFGGGCGVASVVFRDAKPVGEGGQESVDSGAAPVRRDGPGDGGPSRRPLRGFASGGGIWSKMRRTVCHGAVSGFSMKME